MLQKSEEMEHRLPCTSDKETEVIFISFSGSNTTEYMVFRMIKQIPHCSHPSKETQLQMILASTKL